MFNGNAAIHDIWRYPADAAAFPPMLEQPINYRTSVPTSYFLSGTQQASWLPAVHRRLRELAGLPSNWDSYGGRPLLPEMQAAAGTLIQQIAEPGLPMPTIVPTSDGSIQLEWHERGIDLELRLRSQSLYELYFEDATGTEQPIDRELRYDLTPLRVALEILRTR